MRLLLHAVFLKMKKLLQSFKYPLLFYFELDLNMCSKKYFIVFRKMLAKKCINNNKSKLLFRFGQSKWIGEGK